MTPISGVPVHYDWGCPRTIPELLGEQPDGRPLAELWFGAHSKGSSRLPDGRTLLSAVAEAPAEMLGNDVRLTFGDELPFLVKLLAPVKALSLQVHPTKETAARGYDAEVARGIAVDDPARNYPDRNHKPEMVFALTTFEALSGFRAPRRAIEMVESLTAPLAVRMRESLSRRDGTAMQTTFAQLLGAARPRPDDVVELVEEIGARLQRGDSPSPRIDRTVVQLGRWHPGDPGTAAVLLLNPVTLQPGEAMFVGAGNVHCYLAGLGLEVLANSDNVVRAGLTSKHVDAQTLLEIVDTTAAPPVRLGSERVGPAVDVYYAPVDDFVLTVATTLPSGPVRLPGGGPRILVGLDGEVRAHADGEPVLLRPGRAAFVGPAEPAVRIDGHGRVAQVAVP